MTARAETEAARAGVLVIGYGNPGRLDDGLGPALAERIARLGLANVTVDSDYQLTVEDAVHVAEHGVVIFADADTAGPEPFYFKRLQPAARITFSTHSIGPASLLGLAQDLFGNTPTAFVLGIRGYEFNEFGERLSAAAVDNLTAAAEFLEHALRTQTYSEVRAD